MKKVPFCILLFLLCFSCNKSNAGWYKCYNFRGRLNGNSITLSLQVLSGFFGEAGKKNFNVIGIYKYDKFNTPLRLEGKIDFTTSKAYLYQRLHDKNIAVLEFDFSEEMSFGTWKSLSTNSTKTLQLQFLSKLIDTAEASSFTHIPIIQSNSLPKYYFIAKYSKGKGEDQAYMSQLDIIRKDNGTVFQTIDLSGCDGEPGDLMTIIFDNLEIISSKKQLISISNNIGKWNGHFEILFNQATKRFRLNPHAKN